MEQVEKGLDVSIECFQYTGKMQVYNDRKGKFVNIDDQLSFRSKDIIDLQPTSLTKENYAEKLNSILAAR